MFETRRLRIAPALALALLLHLGLLLMLPNVRQLARDAASDAWNYWPTQSGLEINLGGDNNAQAPVPAVEAQLPEGPRKMLDQLGSMPMPAPTHFPDYQAPNVADMRLSRSLDEAAKKAADAYARMGANANEPIRVDLVRWDDVPREQARQRLRPQLDRHTPAPTPRPETSSDVREKAPSSPSEPSTQQKQQAAPAPRPENKTAEVEATAPNPGTVPVTPTAPPQPPPLTPQPNQTEPRHDKAPVAAAPAKATEPPAPVPPVAPSLHPVFRQPGYTAPAPDRGPGQDSADSDQFFSNLTRHLFEANQQELASAIRAGQKVQVEVRFIIARDGRVIGARVERSSGSDMADERAVGTVLAASPMPQMATDMPQDKLELSFPVEVYR